MCVCACLNGPFLTKVPVGISNQMTTFSKPSIYLSPLLGRLAVHHPIEVVERVKKHLEPPYRPELPGLDDDSNPAIIDLILESWNENPDKRPDFETIKKRLRLINKGK